MRICKDVFYEPVASVAFRIGEAVEKTVAFRVFDPVIQIALFFVAKRLPVADQELKIACVWLVDGRVVNFVDDAVAKREPEPAARMISGAETFFGAGRPTWLDTGCAECGRMFRWIYLGSQMMRRVPLSAPGVECGRPQFNKSPIRSMLASAVG